MGGQTEAPWKGFSESTEHYPESPGPSPQIYEHLPSWVLRTESYSSHPLWLVLEVLTPGLSVDGNPMNPSSMPLREAGARTQPLRASFKGHLGHMSSPTADQEASDSPQFQ